MCLFVNNANIGLKEAEIIANEFNNFVLPNIEIIEDERVGTHSIVLLSLRVL